MLFQISVLLQTSENSYKEDPEVEVNAATKLSLKTSPIYRKDKLSTYY